PTQDSGAACIALRPVQAPDQAARAGPRVNLPVRARTIALVWGPDHLARSGPPLSRSVRQVGEAGGELAGVLGLDPLVPVPAHFRAAGGGGQHPQHIGRALPHHHRIHLRIMADLIDPDRFAADPADHRMQPVGSARDQRRELPGRGDGGMRLGGQTTVVGGAPATSQRCRGQRGHTRQQSPPVDGHRSASPAPRSCSSAPGSPTCPMGPSCPTSAAEGGSDAASFQGLDPPRCPAGLTSRVNSGTPSRESTGATSAPIQAPSELAIRSSISAIRTPQGYSPHAPVYWVTSISADSSTAIASEVVVSKRNTPRRISPRGRNSAMFIATCSTGKRAEEHTSELQSRRHPPPSRHAPRPTPPRSVPRSRRPAPRRDPAPTRPGTGSPRSAPTAVPPSPARWSCPSGTRRAGSAPGGGTAPCSSPPAAPG